MNKILVVAIIQLAFFTVFTQHTLIKTKLPKFRDKLLSFLRKELKKEDIDLPDLGEILRKAKAGELDLN